MRTFSAAGASENGDIKDILRKTAGVLVLPRLFNLPPVSEGGLKREKAGI